jgi:hypothetical protein
MVAIAASPASIATYRTPDCLLFDFSMGLVSDLVVGDSVLVEVVLHTGFEVATHAANDLVLEQPIDHVFPIHSERLQTTGVKELLITLNYKHVVTDAALGFYRSSVHR